MDASLIDRNLRVFLKQPRRVRRAVSSVSVDTGLTDTVVLREDGGIGAGSRVLTVTVAGLLATDSVTVVSNGALPSGFSIDGAEADDGLLLVDLTVPATSGYALSCTLVVTRA